MINPMVKFSIKDIERFWSHVAKKTQTECWPWLKCVTTAGYGHFKALGKTWGANRVAYYLHYGVDPGNLEVCHTCDKPACCNPYHLWLGTHRDNLQDASIKGRLSGEKNSNVKLTSTEVKQIRKLYAKGNTTQTELGKLFNISHVNIHYIVCNETWN